MASDPGTEFQPHKPISRWLILFVLLLAFGLAFTFKPAYRHFKSWRARGFISEVESLAKARNWQEAFSKAQAAYNLSPLDSAVIRCVARLYTQLGQPQAIPFWEQLLRSGDATTEDRQQALQLTLTLQRMETAEWILGQLLLSSPNELPTLQKAAQFYSLKGEFPKAISFARRGVQVNPESSELKLLLGRLLVRSQDASEHEEGYGVLQDLARGPDTYALDALILMKDLPGLSPMAYTFVITRLMSHPLAQMEHRLWAYEMRIKMNPDQRESLVETLLQKYSEPTRDQLLALCRWLGKLGDFQRVVQLLPLEKYHDDRDAMLLMLDSLGAMKKWGLVLDIISKGGKQFDPWLKELFLARANMELGQSGEADVHWKRVLVEMPDSPGPILFAARYFEACGQKEDAKRLYRRLAENPSFAKEASSSLVRLAEPGMDTKAVKGLVDSALKLNPSNKAALNDAAYLDLLMGQNLEAARETALKLYTENPSYLAFRTTLALAHMRFKNARFAVDLVDLEIDWKTVLPGWQAVHAMVLMESGRTNDAIKFSKLIPLEKLRKEERALLNGIPY